VTAHPPLVCHIIHRLAVGGLENGLVNLINNLPEKPYRHAVVCLTDVTDFRERIRRDDVEVYAIHKKPGKDVPAYGRLWRLLRQLKPHIVHTRNLPALDSLFVAWLAHVPRLVHGEHGLDMIELDGRNKKYNRLRRLTRLIVDQYVVVSKNLYAWLEHDIEIPPSRLALIYNGVDTRRFSPGGLGKEILPPGLAIPGTVIIGTVGRLEPVKNPLLLAQAFCRVLDLRPALRQILRVIFVGDGSLRDAIEATLTQHDALSLGWLPGFRDDIPAINRAFDIFVLPSLREGISNTALEAMATGRPVVATRVGGNPEIIPDGVAGLLVQPDDPDSLAAAILRYVDNPELRRQHGAAGRAHAITKFSLDAMVEKYDKIYRALLATRAGRGMTGERMPEKPAL
jgi:sugar transferase (PEP-CTERM/EpsH1 system associated)